jgi:transcriptional regulator with XRE-family HTH domain
VTKRSATKSTRLSQKLKRIRVTLGLSQNEILDRLGFSESLFRSNVSQYERGARVPSPKVLLQYARLAKVDLAVLIDDDMDLPARFSSQRTRSRKK